MLTGTRKMSQNPQSTPGSPLMLKRSTATTIESLQSPRAHKKKRRFDQAKKPDSAVPLKTIESDSAAPESTPEPPFMLKRSTATTIESLQSPRAHKKKRGHSAAKGRGSVSPLKTPEGGLAAPLKTPAGKVFNFVRHLASGEFSKVSVYKDSLGTLFALREEKGQDPRRGKKRLYSHSNFTKTSENFERLPWAKGKTIPLCRSETKPCSNDQPHAWLMPFLEGETLDQYVEKQIVGKTDITYEEGLNQLIGLCITAMAQLIHLHNQGFIHCDIKPDNFITNGTEVWLIDPDTLIPRGDRADESKCNWTYNHNQAIFNSPAQGQHDTYALGKVFESLLTKCCQDEGEKQNKKYTDFLSTLQGMQEKTEIKVAKKQLEKMLEKNTPTSSRCQ